jgi:hypothetical protein
MLGRALAHAAVVAQRQLYRVVTNFILALMAVEILVTNDNNVTAWLAGTLDLRYLCNNPTTVYPQTLCGWW